MKIRIFTGSSVPGAQDSRHCDRFVFYVALIVPVTHLTVSTLYEHSNREPEVGQKPDRNVVVVRNALYTETVGELNEGLDELMIV